MYDVSEPNPIEVFRGDRFAARLKPEPIDAGCIPLNRRGAAYISHRAMPDRRVQIDPRGRYRVPAAERAYRGERGRQIQSRIFLHLSERSTPRQPLGERRAQRLTSPGSKGHRADRVRVDVWHAERPGKYASSRPISSSGHLGSGKLDLAIPIRSLWSTRHRRPSRISSRAYVFTTSTTRT